MTTLILSSLGGAVGSLFGPIGAMAGSYLGGTLGSYIDRKIFNSNRVQNIAGYRLDDLSIQTSTFGKTISIIFGSMRVSGNIIWSMPVKEVITTETISQNYGKGFSSKPTIEKTNYNYYINIAIGICEGEIDSIDRIWADTKLLDKSKLNFRFYSGSENQNPDPLIQSIEGIENTPAYRGLAYIVIEDFRINDFGNRIPNFTFEVKRNLINDRSVERRIKGINVIPGCGEFVYDTDIQFKIPLQSHYDPNNIGFFPTSTKSRINNNTEFANKSDAIVALDQLKENLPNLEYISVVVVWFGNSLEAGQCKIYPAVESYDYHTSPDEWRVAGLNRWSAQLITRDKDNNPIYGGTPSDKSVVKYLKELKKRGYKVILYPMIFMDIPDKPWRGRIAPKQSYLELIAFFGTEDHNSNSYEFTYFEFIKHYANLTKDYIDGMVIGSELKGITSFYGQTMLGNYTYFGVDKLIELAGIVRKIIEPIKGDADQTREKIITYAADWSEYHSVNGDFNMDPLWVCDDINVIGIDAYFPLTDFTSYSYQPSREEIMNGWTSGEGYEYYYENDDGIRIADFKENDVVSSEENEGDLLNKEKIIKDDTVVDNEEVVDEDANHSINVKDNGHENSENNNEENNPLNLESRKTTEDNSKENNIYRAKDNLYNNDNNQINNIDLSNSKNNKKRKKVYYRDPIFAWKNIQYWWENYHKDKNGNNSEWKPRMKKIWFTEYGFPSIHANTNMPNVFYNPESIDGGLPIYSNGGINFDIQRIAIEATIDQWQNSPMVEKMFLWCYDARPYPQFPLAKSIWSDGDLWVYGHWINGKLNRCLLSRILENLLSRVLGDNDHVNEENKIIIDTRQISQSIDGYIINNNISILDCLKILKEAYFFDLIEKERSLNFKSHDTDKLIKIPHENIVLENNIKQLTIRRSNIYDSPRSVSLSFMSSIDNYEVRTVSVTDDSLGKSLLYHNEESRSDKNLNIDLPIVMGPDYANCIAQAILYSNQYQREVYDFSLSPAFSYLEPGDFIELEIQEDENGREQILKKMRIVRILHANYIKVQAVIDDRDLYYFRQGRSLLSSTLPVIPNKISKTQVSYAILPPLFNEDQGSIVFACCGEEEYWEGAVIFQDRTGNLANLDRLLSVNRKSCFGKFINGIEGNIGEFRSGVGKNDDKINDSSDDMRGGGYRSDQEIDSVDHQVDTEEMFDNDTVYRKYIDSNKLNTIIFLDIKNHLILDSKNSIYVHLNNGELESIESYDLYLGKNLAYLGNETSGEIFQFQNAELIEQNTYKLTNLRRGLFGTEFFINKHTTNENFILLDDRVARLPLKDEDAGSTKNIKIISFGDSIENSTDLKIYCKPNYIYNYAICNLHCWFDDNDLNLSWNFRVRIDEGWMNFRDVIDNDLNSQYEIIIMKVDGEVISREKIKNTNYQYKTDARDMIFVIYKVSSVFGRGYGLKVEIKNRVIVKEEVIIDIQ